MIRAAGVLVGLLLLLAGAGWFAVVAYDRPGPLEEPRTVVIPRAGLDQVAETLEQAGVVQSALALRAAALATRGQGSVKAAELAFPARASLRQVLTVLRSGRPVQHRLTIPEGLTSAQVAALLDKAPALEGDTPVPPEGSVLPETYSYELGTTRAALLERAAKAMDRALERAWAARVPGLPLENARQALVLASIVERETARADERPRVAAVFVNRLRRGMKLQSDPTVVYGVSGGAGVLDHGLTRAELDSDTPYNTYKFAGLPPGPIAMPGLDAIKAVTQPGSGDELFFVADGSGGHVFARTEAEHNRNVVRWREVERQRARAVPASN